MLIWLTFNRLSWYAVILKRVIPASFLELSQLSVIRKVHEQHLIDLAYGSLTAVITLCFLKRAISASLLGLRQLSAIRKVHEQHLITLAYEALTAEIALYLGG